jgi:uncharacterized protein involved in outer membrane biogenesis
MPDKRQGIVLAARSTMRTRRLWPWVSAGTLLLLLGGVAVCEWQGWPFLKAPLQQGLAQRLQRRVEFGDGFALHLLGGLRLETRELAIGAPPWTAGPKDDDTLRASDVHLALPFSTVMQRLRSEPARAHIKRLQVSQINVNFRRGRNGHADWTLTAEPTPPTGDAERLQLPQIDELVIESGRVSVDDALLRMQVDATVSTIEGDRETHAKGLAIDGTGHYQQRPFEFHLKSAGLLPLVAPANPEAAVPISLQARAGKTRAEFVGKAVDVLSLEGLDGEIALSGTSLASVGDALGITLPTTSAFTLKGHLAKQRDVWGLKVARLDVGESRLGGDFKFDRGPKVPVLTGELTGQRFVLADLAPAFGAPTAEAPKKQTKAPGRVLPDREFDIPSLLMMNAEVRLRLQRAELGTLFAEPLLPLQGDLALRDGVLRVSNLVARTAGGELRGGVELDPKPAQPLWTADLRWSGIDLERWISVRNVRAAQAKAGGPAPGYVSGQLKGRAQLRSHGSSTAQLVASLEGTVNTWVQNGQISHLVVEAIGLRLAQVLGLLFSGDKPIPMDCALAQLKAGKGRITPEVLIIDTPSATLLADGTVSLIDERLALTINSEPKKLSALSLRTPVHVEGTFAQPKVRLDANPLALKVLGALTLAAINPLAAVLPTFDTGDPQAQACANVLHRWRGDKAAVPLQFEPPAAGRIATPAKRGGAAAPPKAPSASAGTS